MTRSPVHYSRAPIAEAVIDLQTHFVSEPDLAALEAMAADISEAFPQKHQINTFQFAVGQNAEGKQTADVAPTSVLGLRLTSASQLRVLQLRKQGMSFSHLAPYTEWDAFTAELKPLWNRYVEAFLPTEVSRLAVRYINRIELPLGADLDRYLNLTPRLLSGVSEAVEGYFMQLVLPQRDLGERWKAIINTGLEGVVAGTDKMNVLLDIDVFCEVSVDVRSSEVWELLARLRDRKNKVFESAITDEIRRQIE